MPEGLLAVHAKWREEGGCLPDCPQVFVDDRGHDRCQFFGHSLSIPHTRPPDCKNAAEAFKETKRANCEALEREGRCPYVDETPRFSQLTFCDHKCPHLILNTNENGTLCSCNCRLKNQYLTWNEINATFYINAICQGSEENGPENWKEGEQDA
ncbi:MAG: hypothetical protein ACYTEQ_01245 [Planctomycetota bacterium]|jgi:hypothetical protein